MATNVGRFDRFLRLVLGAGLILAPFFTALAIWDNTFIQYGAITAGIILVLTALASSCPLYSLLGIRTCGRG